MKFLSFFFPKKVPVIAEEVTAAENILEFCFTHRNAIKCVEMIVADLEAHYLVFKSRGSFFNRHIRETFHARRNYWLRVLVILKQPHSSKN